MLFRSIDDLNDTTILQLRHRSPRMMKHAVIPVDLVVMMGLLRM